MTGGGQYVEVQGTGENATFSEQDLTQLLRMARRGIRQLTDMQHNALGKAWPFA